MRSMTHEERLRRIGLSMPDVLLPAPHVDLDQWVVVACDQHVHDDSYWRRARDRIGDAPSALPMVLPESDLDSPDPQALIATIHATMERIAASGALRPCGPGMVVVRREERGRADRVGLLASFDLEAWHDHRLAHALRPTESVVESRMPARTSIREGALLEIPHLLALADDLGGILRDALDRALGEEVYRVDLPESTASVRALHVGPHGLDPLVRALESVAVRHRGAGPYSWFVGDGNHSLEAARRRWDALRRNLSVVDREHHPARFAMGELVPFASPGVDILPVLRQIRGVHIGDLLESCSIAGFEPSACLPGEMRSDPSSCGLLASGRAWRFALRESTAARFAAVDAMLAELETRNPSIRLDYLHGWCEAVAPPGDAIVLVLPAFTREELRELFQGGHLCPRKSFSLGGPADKRHYLEARALRPLPSRMR